MSYYEYSKPHNARSILNLAVKHCSGSFSGCFWAGIKAVLGVVLRKALVFKRIVRLKIYSVLVGVTDTNFATSQTLRLKGILKF